MYFQKYMYVRKNLYASQKYMHCFQKYMTTKSDLQIFPVCVVGKYRLNISQPDIYSCVQACHGPSNHRITFYYQKQHFIGVVQTTCFF